LKMAPRKLLVGMRLGGQPHRAIERFDQHVETLAASHFIRVFRQQGRKRDIGFLDCGKPFQSIRRIRVERAHLGSDPLLRLITVHGFVAEKLLEELASGIDPEDPVSIEEKRMFKKILGNGCGIVHGGDQ